MAALKSFCLHTATPFALHYRLCSSLPNGNLQALTEILFGIPSFCSAGFSFLAICPMARLIRSFSQRNSDFPGPRFPFCHHNNQNVPWGSPAPERPRSTSPMSPVQPERINIWDVLLSLIWSLLFVSCLSLKGSDFTAGNLIQLMSKRKAWMPSHFL